MKLLVVLLAAFSLVFADLGLDWKQDTSDIFDTRAPAPNRGFQQIQSGIKGAISGHHACIKILSSFNDSGPVTEQQLSDLQNQFNLIANSLQQAIDGTNSSGPLTAKQCKQVFTSLGSLATVVSQVLDDIVAHKAAFQQAGVLNVICNDLKEACALLQQLLQNLIKLSSGRCMKQLIKLLNFFESRCKDALAQLGCP